MRTNFWLSILACTCTFVGLAVVGCSGEIQDDSSTDGVGSLLSCDDPNLDSDANACRPDGSSCDNAACPDGTLCNISADGLICHRPDYGPTCSTLRCPAGTRCVETDAQGAICLDDPDCRDANRPDDTCNNGLTCANVLCQQGSTCHETANGPICIPDSPCSNVQCADANTRCIVASDGRPACVNNVTCRDIRCEDGFGCVEGSATDAEGDTSSGPRCVPHQGDPCDLVSCPDGTHCEVRDNGGDPVDRNQPGDETDPDNGADGNADETDANGTDRDNDGRADGDEPPNGSGVVCVPDRLTCANLDCMDDSECRETPEGPRCFPVGHCEPGDANCCPDGSADCCHEGDENCHPQLTCANVLCDADTRCIETATGPMCVPFDDPCALIDCAPGFECQAWDNGEAECVPTLSCANVLCAPGHYCVETDAQGPQCIPDPDTCDVNADGTNDCNPANPCDVISCEQGSHCIVTADGDAACISDMDCSSVNCPDNSRCQISDNGEVACVR